MSYQYGVPQPIVIKAYLLATGAKDTSATPPTVLISKDGGTYSATAGTLVQSGATNKWIYTPTVEECQCEELDLDCDRASSFFVNSPIYLEKNYTAIRAGYLDTEIGSRLASGSYTAPDNAGITTLIGIFTGMTSLPRWLRGLFRKDAMDAIAQGEINVGGGEFSPLTDSLEAVRDAMLTDKEGYSLTVDYPKKTDLPDAPDNATIGEINLVVDGIAEILGGESFPSVPNIVTGLDTTSVIASRIANIFAKINGVKVTVNNPVTVTGDVIIVPGNDYGVHDISPLSWTVEGIDLETAVVTFYYNGGSIEMDTVSEISDGKWMVSHALTAAQSLVIPAGAYRLRAVWPDDTVMVLPIRGVVVLQSGMLE